MSFVSGWLVSTIEQLLNKKGENKPVKINWNTVHPVARKEFFGLQYHQEKGVDGVVNKTMEL